MPQEHLWFLNNLVAIRVSENDGTDGLSVLEFRAPLGDSAPLHIHRTEDEIFHILEGDVRFQVGKDQIKCGPGTIMVAPKGIPHTYRVESASGARWTTVTAHGDFEKFVRKVSRPAQRIEVPATQAPTPEMVAALTAIAREYGIDLIGPPLG